jgi:hypothetical protein
VPVKLLYSESLTKSTKKKKARLNDEARLRYNALRVQCGVFLLLARVTGFARSAKFLINPMRAQRAV